MDDKEKNQIADAIRLLAHAVSAPAGPGHDAQGGTVDSLTEAMMGVTAANTAIANEMSRIADALEIISSELHTLNKKR